MKKLSQIIIKILLILSLFQFILTTTSQASFWGDIFSEGQNFVENGKNEVLNPDEGEKTIDGDEVKKEIDRLYNILFAGGVVLAVIIGAILGIKLMFGGIEEQAKVKETLFPYVVGCIVIFGSFGIWKLVIVILSSVT